VSGGGDGGLSVWRVSPNYEKVCSSKPNSQGPVAGLAVRNNQVIAAFTSGVIQILSQVGLRATSVPLCKESEETKKKSNGSHLCDY
jgi:hypothetical protein